MKTMRPIERRYQEIALALGMLQEARLTPATAQKIYELEQELEEIEEILERGESCTMEPSS